MIVAAEFGAKVIRDNEQDIELVLRRVNRARHHPCQHQHKKTCPFHAPIVMTRPDDSQLRRGVCLECGVPEGHTIHRLARDQTKSIARQTLRVSSPQGRFALGDKALGA